ncbi:MAG: hypothetical protein IH591_09000 [Bacteroidales bacterium]|nr:hypothetical protein [Bacteroidales bacterium]
MKRALLIIVLLGLSAGLALAQSRVRPNRPYRTFNSRPGYITINEIGGGFGLAGTASPYSKYFGGFTSVHSYQVDGALAIGAGTGLSFYEDGLLIPLFMDIRYRISAGSMDFYLFGDGGFMLNPSDFNSGTKMFINAGGGYTYVLQQNLALNIGPALLIQMGPGSRASFLNLKVGITFKPQ